MEVVSRSSRSSLISELISNYTQGRVARDVKSMAGKDVFLKGGTPRFRLQQSVLQNSLLLSMMFCSVCSKFCANIYQKRAVLQIFRVRSVTYC